MSGHFIVHTALMALVICVSLLPCNAERLLITYSTATLLSGEIDDCPTINASTCQRGVATCMAFARDLKATAIASPNDLIMFLPTFDHQTLFVQMHPLSWGVNAVVF